MSSHFRTLQPSPACASELSSPHDYTPRCFCLSASLLLSGFVPSLLRAFVAFRFCFFAPSRFKSTRSRVFTRPLLITEAPGQQNAYPNPCLDAFFQPALRNSAPLRHRSFARFGSLHSRPSSTLHLDSSRSPQLNSSIAPGLCTVTFSHYRPVMFMNLHDSASSKPHDYIL